MIATSGFLTALKCTKFVFGPDPLGKLTELPRPSIAGLRSHTYKSRRVEEEGVPSLRTFSQLTG